MKKQGFFVVLLAILTVFAMIGCSSPSGGDGTVAVSSVTIDQAEESPKALFVGDTITLTATVLPANAANKAVTWESSDETVASVDENGEVNALKPGAANITAKAGGKTSANFVVSVSVPAVPVQSVTINEIEDSPRTIRVGDANFTLTATVEPANASSKTVTWTSDNTAVASVGRTTGVVSAIGKGTARITAAAGGVASAAAYEVNVLPPFIKTIAITPKSVYLEAGEKQSLNYSISPNGVEVQTVKWASDNTAVATVNETTGEVTAVGKGQAVITVTSDAKDSEGNAKTDTCEIDVVVWKTIFNWDAESDLSFADIGADLPLGSSPEAFSYTVPSAIGTFRMVNYDGKDYVMQSYMYNGNTIADKFAVGTPLAVQALQAGSNTVKIGYTLDGDGKISEYTTAEYAISKKGYLLNEGTNPCLQIGSTGRGRTTADSLPTDYNIVTEGSGYQGQFDLSDTVFRVTVEYTPLKNDGGEANFMYGTIYNSGATSLTATPWPGRIGAGTGGSEYVYLRDLAMGQMQTFKTGSLDTRNLGEAAKTALKTGFITVRAAVSGTILVVHSIKIEVVDFS